MRTIILQGAIKVLIPIFFVYSLYLLFRGHDRPGGGFIGALVISIGLIFHMVAFGVYETQRIYRIDTTKLASVGLLIAFIGATLALLVGKDFFSALWSPLKVPGIGTLSSVMLFDIGVYLAVIGAILKIAFTIFKE